MRGESMPYFYYDPHLEKKHIYEQRKFFLSYMLCMSLQHMMVMEDMLKDFLLGEHLLLVGNQVGKPPSL